MPTVSLYLNFPGTTREAFAFYRDVLGGDYLGVLTFRELGAPEGATEADLDLIAHVALRLPGGMVLMGTDMLASLGQSVVAGTNAHVVVEADDAEQAHRIFEALSQGGAVAMPLGPTAWAELYGMCTDRFGLQWMISFTGDVDFRPGG